MRGRTRRFGMLIAAATLLWTGSAAASTCGFSCTVGDYLDMPADARAKFIERNARVSRKSRNRGVKKCVEGLSDEQIRVIFETYVEKRPNTRLNRATNAYAMAIGECDKSELADLPPAAPEPAARKGKAARDPLEKRLVASGIPRRLLERWFPGDSAERNPLDTMKMMIEDGYFIEAFQVVIELPASKNSEYVEWATSNAERLPGAFLYEIGKRVPDGDKIAAWNWYFAGRLRTAFESAVCAEPDAQSGSHVVRAFALRELEERGDIGQAERISSSRWATEWYRQTPYAISPRHGCRLLLRTHAAYENARDGKPIDPPGKPIPDQPKLRPEAQWKTIRP